MKNKIGNAAIFIIRVYQHTLSPDHGLPKQLIPSLKVCVFYPTCSEYMILAIQKHGPLRGIWKGTKRILRCHPWQKNHYDPA